MFGWMQFGLIQTQSISGPVHVVKRDMAIALIRSLAQPKQLMIKSATFKKLDLSPYYTLTPLSVGQ